MTAGRSTDGTTVTLLFSSLGERVALYYTCEHGTYAYLYRRNGSEPLKVLLRQIQKAREKANQNNR